MTKYLLIACTALALSACNRDQPADTAAAPAAEPTTAPTSASNTSTNTSGGPQPYVSQDHSLPSSDVVFNEAPADADGASHQSSHEADKAMTKTEESQTMPKPGQANDYSTGLRSEKMGTGNDR